MSQLENAVADFKAALPKPKKRKPRPHAHKERTRTLYVEAGSDVHRAKREAIRLRRSLSMTRAAALRKQRLESLLEVQNTIWFEKLGINHQEEQLLFLQIKSIFLPLMLSALNDAGLLHASVDDALKAVGVAA